MQDETDRTYCQSHREFLLGVFSGYCLFFALVRAGANTGCPTAIHLRRLGESKVIESSLPSQTTLRWNVFGHGRPIRVNVTRLRMGTSIQTGIFKKYCPVTPRLKVADNKYSKYPLIVVCGTDSFSFVSYSDFLNISHLGGSRGPSSFTLEVTSVECGQDHYVCPSDKNKCVTIDKMCDGRQDCSNGEDEICTEKCGEAGSANAKNPFRGKIVGGEEAAAHSWPWQVLMRADNGTQPTTCGGSIIAPQWILTAGHCCVAEHNGIIRPYGPNNVQIGTGMHYREKGRPISSQYAKEVAKVIVSPAYEYPYNSEMPVPQHDFCLLKLKQPLVYSQKVGPICLPQLPEPPKGTSCYSTGWGLQQEPTGPGDLTGTTSEVLQEVDETIQTTNVCTNPKYAAEMGRNMDVMSPDTICTLQHLKGTCKGDSGGPLSCRLPKTDHFQWQLVGVTSYGLVCGGTPSFYARVRRGLPFIANTLYEENYDGWFANRTIKVYSRAARYGPEDFNVSIPPRDPRFNFTYDKEPDTRPNGWIGEDQCRTMRPTPSTNITASGSSLEFSTDIKFGSTGDWVSWTEGSSAEHENLSSASLREGHVSVVSAAGMTLVLLTVHL